MDVCITLNCYAPAVLCHTLFQGTGPGIPLVEVLWQMVANMQNGAAPFITNTSKQCIPPPAMTSIYFASILRAVQVQVQENLHAVAGSNAGINPPKFCGSVTDLKRGTFPQSTNWVPLPEEYLATPHPAHTGGSGASVTRGHGSTPAGMGSGGSTPTTICTAVSSAAHRPFADTSATNRNPNPDSAFTSSIVVRPGGTRPIPWEHRPPHKQRCGTRILRRAMVSVRVLHELRAERHARPVRVPDRAQCLLTFYREHLSAPPAGSHA
ncbi:hypothetical protein MHU86_5065 [Fragilaria crotonensis]|nr:hypothetical protein MHU86_5065 [Fragilaria crotonensis]